MTYDALLAMIQHFGYAALFFALWLGIVGMPIPDEVIVMTGGAVAASGVLQPIPAFLLTYLGVASGLSLGYVLGRFIGTPIMDRLRRKKKMERYLHFSERLVQQYGNYALCISYFFPVVRHVMPYVVGINRMSFKRYALFSYSTGFVWTAAFFAAGGAVGGHVREAGYAVHHYGLKLLWLPVVLIAVYFILKYYKKERGRDSI